MSVVDNKKIVGLTLTALAICLGGLNACSKNESATSLVAEARQFQQKGDTKAAIIQLKNALAKDGNDIAARQLLGQIYNQIGDGASAEKELRKAISLGLAADKAMPDLAAALLRQGQFQKVLDETQALSLKGSAEISTLRGNALLGLNRPAEAKAAFDAALKATPDYAQASLGLARWALATGDAAAAESLTEQAIKTHPADVEVLTFKAALERAQGKGAEAKAAFAAVLKVKPDDGSAHLQLALLDIQDRQFDAAQSELNAAKKAAPSNLLNTYAQALLDFSQGKNAAALEAVQQVLSGAPDHWPSVLLAGAVQNAMGSMPQAEQHLKKYVEHFPDNLYARKLLASTLIRTGQAKDAVATLAPYAKDSKDAQLLAILGDASMASHDFAGASAYFERASAIAPDVSSLHASLGVSRLNQGESALGLAELERATALDKTSTRAAVLLTMAELRAGHFDKALAVATNMEKAAPTNPMAPNLKGGAYLGKKDFANARASFEKALTLQADFFPAVNNLAQLDSREGQPDAARKRYEKFIEGNKKHGEAIAALADLLIAQGKPAEATSWLERGASEDPNALAPGLRLAGHYAKSGDKGKALTLLRKLQVANPDNPQLLDLLGQVQMASDDRQGALETFSRLAGRMLNSASAQLRVASAQMALNNHEAAIAALRKAVSLQPDYLDAQIALFNQEARFGSGEQALAIARTVQKQKPKQAIGFVLEGDLMGSQKKTAAAVSAYEKAYALGKTPQTLIKLAEALRVAGRQKDADTRVAQWRKEFPADLVVPLYVADGLLTAKKYPQAIEQLQGLAKAAPKNPVVLNNLAVTYQQAKDPRALATAEQAYQYAGNSPAVMDTLGWILVEQGNATRALPLLRKAVGMAPASPDFRYHLAVSMVKTQDKAGARKELEQLLATNKNFAQADEARSLLKQL